MHVVILLGQFKSKLEFEMVKSTADGIAAPYLRSVSCATQWVRQQHYGKALDRSVDHLQCERAVRC
jgi:hypothetical protein